MTTTRGYCEYCCPPEICAHCGSKDIEEEGFEDIIKIRNLEQRIAEADALLVCIRESATGLNARLIMDYIKKYKL